MTQHLLSLRVFWEQQETLSRRLTLILFLLSVSAFGKKVQQNDLVCLASFAAPPASKIGFIYEENGIYKASPDAVAGRFYEYNGDWFYIAKTTDDLKEKTLLWNNWTFGDNNTVRMTITDDDNSSKDILANNIVTSRITSMNSLFQYKASFNQEIRAWDVSNVTDMRSMFQSASDFNQQIENWDVSSVTNMFEMFKGATKFNQPIGDWEVSSVTNMASMFQSAPYFNRPIGNWDVSSVTDMSYMFYMAYAFNQFLGNWDVSSVTDMGYMFTRANSFNGGIGSWDVSNVTSMSHMFDRAVAFNKPIGDWDVGKVTDMEYMFFMAYEFNYPIGDWNVSSVTNMHGMFGYASSFNRPIGNWDVGNVTTMHGMFRSAFAFNQPIGDWDVSKVTDMRFMFIDALAFNHPIGNWDVSSVTDMGLMFKATSFNRDIGNWDVSSVTRMDDMFALTSFNQNIGNWDVSNVTTMDNMFYKDSHFNQPIGNWDVGNVTSMSYMFYGATSFNQPIGNWDVSKVAFMSSMFAGATSFNQPIGDWDVSKVVTMQDMFYEASAFNQNLGLWKLKNDVWLIRFFNLSGESCENYSLSLRGWAENSSIGSRVRLEDQTVFFSPDVLAARNHLINAKGWTISGDTPGVCTIPSGLNYVYENNIWTPSHPSGVATQDDNIIIVNGEIAFSGIITGKNVTINSGATLDIEGILNVYGHLTINGNLTFKSTAATTGELCIIKGTITGAATVENYMQDVRSYRMVSSAVTTTTRIHANWQEGAVSNTDNPAPGYGTHITGTKNDQQNGFDGTQTGNPSMWTVDAAAQQFVPIPNTNIKTLKAGDSYLMFIRGDRGIELNSNNSHSSTTLRAKGTLYKGSQKQNFNTTTAGAFAMFGNPYQSAVDVNTLFATATNVNPSVYYVYDAGMGETGNYVTVILPEGTNGAGSPANQFLQPGQAAQFATAGSGNASIKFVEAQKAPGNHTAISAVGNDIQAHHKLNIQLFTTENYNQGKRAHDALTLLFDSTYSNDITLEDAVKPMGFRENIAIENSGKLLSMEKRAMPVASEVYKLYSSGYTKDSYLFKLDVNGLEENQLYLDDSYTGSSTLLEEGEVLYSFTIDGSEASQANDRFSIRVEERLGITDNALAGIRLFPNPINSETFYIHAPKLNGETVEVHISDLAGRNIYNETLIGISNKLTIKAENNLASGVYLVTLKTKGVQQTLRLVKE